MRKTVFALVAALLTLPLAVAGQIPDESEQEEIGVLPGHGFLLTGYGSAGYSAVFLAEEMPNDFVAAVNPLMLFQISDRFLFEAEVEFELEEGVTETGLESAQIDYALSNNFKVVAGKFLLPFNIFSERLHPIWIHKFASSPLLYGHGSGSGPTAPLLCGLGGRSLGKAPVLIEQGPPGAGSRSPSAPFCEGSRPPLQGPRGVIHPLQTRQTPFSEALRGLDGTAVPVSFSSLR